MIIIIDVKNIIYKMIPFFGILFAVAFAGPAVEDDCCSVSQAECNALPTDWCTDLEYLYTYYTNYPSGGNSGTGKCPQMGCDGVCGSNNRMDVYYLDEDGDGWGLSIAGKYCETTANTIETTGEAAASESAPGFKVLNREDISETCYCPENTYAECFDCLGNCKYRNNGSVDPSYIGDDNNPVDLSNACSGSGQLGCNECDECNGGEAPIWYQDSDGDGQGDPNNSTQACSQPSGYVANNGDLYPNCATNNPDEAGVCNGDNYVLYCTDLEYLNTNYPNTGKCPNMGCDGVVDSNVRMYIYYLDEDGDGHGTSIAGKFCMDEANTVETTPGSSAASESNAGYKVLNHPDFSEECYCPENTDADCYDCLGNCKYNSNGSSNNNYIGDDNSPVNLTNACSDTDRLGCNDCDECNGSSPPTWYQDSDGDGQGVASNTQQSCTQPSGYVGDISVPDPEPNCATNDTDECGVCGGENFTSLCTDLDYLNANYLADGKCPNMGCDGACNSSTRMRTYYLDEDGDGWGLSIAGNFCEDTTSPQNTIELTGTNVTSTPGSYVVQSPDVSETCPCRLNTDADCYDCLGNCKYIDENQNINANYIGIQTSPVNLTTACSDTGRLGCNTCDECNGDAPPIWYQDSDGDGKGDPAVSQSACTQPSNYVLNSNDLEPNCATNDTDECGVCGGDNYEIYCTDLNYINANYLADGKCPNMGCDGACNSSTRMNTYYLDEDGDGWGQSIAGNYCEDEANTIEDTGTNVSSIPGYYVVQRSDISETCFCRDNTDASCYDCLGNCKYSAPNTISELYIGDDEDDVNLTNACPDTGRLGCNECGICQGDSTPIWYSDADADGKGDPETTLESCTALDGYVQNSNDFEPECATNDTDECGICAGDGYEVWCTDLEYLNANYLDSGKCENMGCDGICDSSERMNVYYLDADGDGWGVSIAGKFCSTDFNTIEDTGTDVLSTPGSFVVQNYDVDDATFCKENTFDLCNVCGGTNIDEGACSNVNYLDQVTCEDESEVWTSVFSGPDIDCNGECGGVAELDECGVCGGNNLTKDCNGICGGSDKFDVCGICSGSNLDESSCSDPDYTDQLSCVASEEIWSTLFSGPDVDCSGECGGIAELDDCGVCNGGNKSKDCAGVCNGESVLDDCGVCDGQNQKDPLGNCVFVIHPGDANMDQRVDVSDLNAIVANWGKRVGWKRTEIDFNGSAVFSKYDWSPQVLNINHHIDSENECLLYADANSDGKINLWDVTAIYLNQGSSHSYTPLYAESCNAELSRDKEDIYYQIYNNLPDSDLKNKLEKEFGFRALPDEFKLYPNYPNPFNPSTLIHFEVPYTQSVTLEIISIKGELIETELFTNLEQGFYSHLWDAKEYSSGIYFSRLLVDGKIVGLNKMLLVK